MFAHLALALVGLLVLNDSGRHRRKPTKLLLRGRIVEFVVT
jgi:hypothetical protein